MKKQLLIPLCTVIGIACVGGAVFGITKYNESKTVIDVIPVSNISAYYYGDENSSDGLVTSNVSQEIYLMENQLVKEVYVKEGDQVSIGDKLMEYDTTLTELDLEAKKISLNKINLQIKDLNKQITNLKNGNYAGGFAKVPIEHTLSTTGEITDTGSTSNPPESEGTPDSSDPSGSQNTDNPPVQPQETPNPPTPSDPVPTDPVPTDPVPTDPVPTDPIPTDPVPSPSKKLDWNTEFVESGSDLIVECGSDWEITPEFIYKIMGYDETGTTQDESKIVNVTLRITDSETGKTYAWTLRGDRLEIPEDPVDTTTVGDYIDNHLVFNMPDPDDPGSDFPGGDFGPVYTQEEINQMIKEKQQEIASLQLSIKQANLDITKLENTLKESTVKSTVNGIVKSAGDPLEGAEEGKPFMVVDSEEGLYLTGSVSELQLNLVNVGQPVSVMSWNSGMTYEATITEISPYPSSANFYYGSNPNVSSYPFKAYIENSDGLRNNEYVQISMNTQSRDTDTNALYIYKAYILSENGHSYVYIQDENEKLKKQEVTTGKTIYGSYIEIKTGLSEADYIAFPYGKGLKDGAHTTVQTDIYY